MKNLIESLTIENCYLLMKNDIQLNISKLMLNYKVEVTKDNYLKVLNNVTGLLLSNAYKQPLNLFVKN